MSSRPPKNKPEKAAKPRSRLRKVALGALVAFVVLVPATWIAIHEVPGFGPALADGTRAVLGPGVVAWAEDFTYGIQDRVNRLRYKDAKPTTFWDESSAAPAAAAPPSSVDPSPSSSAAAAAPKDFPPPAYDPPYPAVASDGDGHWIAMNDGFGAPPFLFKSLVHPDPKRSFAAVAVVAIDLRRAALHLVPGTQEPANDKIPASHRPGVVPKDALTDLVAAFNGGFKALHGHYGMMLDGETYVQPRDIACTIGLFKDGSVKIATWPEIKDSEPEMIGYRQTPPCLVEHGKTNQALDVEYNRNWGATVSGETVIRRSAIGIDASGHTLFYGLGEAVTAQALSRAMRAVGLEAAAQLDVNYSYPRFLTYQRDDGTPHVSSAIIPGIKFEKDEYVGRPELRDFFYLTRRPTES